MTRNKDTQHPKMFEIFNYLVDYKQKNDGCAPSTAEIKRACNISSTSQVRHYIRMLEADTAIQVRGTRNIRVNGGSWEMQ